MNNNNIELNIRKFLDDKAFLISLFLTIMMYALRFSLLDNYIAFKYLFIAMRLISYSLLAIKFIYDYFKGNYNGTKAYIILFGLFFLLISYKSRTINYLLYYIYIVVGKDIKYISIIKTAFTAIVISILIIVICCKLKLIEDIIAYKGTRNRHSLGFKYTSYLATYTFYAVLYYIYIRNKNIRLVELIILLVINFTIFKLTNTRNPFIFGLTAIVLTFFYRYVSVVGIYNSFYSLCMKIASVTFPILIVLISYFYNENNALLSFFNKMISGRLRLGYSALHNYGIKLFGQYVKITSGGVDGEVYNVIDSAHILHLVLLGLAFYILTIVFFLYFAKLIEEKKDVCLSYIFVIIISHAMFDPQLLHISHNVFLFILSYKNSNVNYEQ